MVRTRSISNRSILCGRPTAALGRGQVARVGQASRAGCASEGRSGGIPNTLRYPIGSCTDRNTKVVAQSYHHREVLFLPGFIVHSGHVNGRSACCADDKKRKEHSKVTAETSESKIAFPD